MESNYLTESGSLDVSSSALSVPLLKVDGSTFGALTIYSTSASAFSNEHLRILQVVEPKFSLSIQNALQFDTAETDIEAGPPHPDSQYALLPAES